MQDEAAKPLGMAARASSRSLPGRRRGQPETPAASSGEEDESMGEEEEEDRPQDGLDDLSAHELAVRTLRETIELKKAVRMGNAGKHEFKRIDQNGACGVCSDKGSRLWCKTCNVRLCRDTDCWNRHMNGGAGNTVPKKSTVTEAEDQGAKKEIEGRAREWEEAED